MDSSLSNGSCDEPGSASELTSHFSGSRATDFHRRSKALRQRTDNPRRVVVCPRGFRARGILTITPSARRWRSRALTPAARRWRATPSGARPLLSGHEPRPARAHQVARRAEDGGEIERAFKTAAALDEQFDYAGPDPCLGLLYYEAPASAAWGAGRRRASISNARRNCAGLPLNRLNLAEAYLKWREKKLLQRDTHALEKSGPRHRQIFPGRIGSGMAGLAAARKAAREFGTAAEALIRRQIQARKARGSGGV